MFRTGQAGEKGSGSSALSGSAGRDTLALGVQTHQVTFPIAKSNVFYEPFVTIENSVDADPIFLQFYVKNILTTGFLVVFNAPTDSANYKLCWSVIDDI